MFETTLDNKFVKHLADYIEDRLYDCDNRKLQLPPLSLALWIRDAEKTWKQGHSNLKVE